MNRRQLLAASLLAALVLLPVGALGVYAWSKHRWAAERLAELEPRYARLLGLEATQAEMAQARRAAEAHLARYAFPASRDVSQTGSEAQQRVRNVATTAGMTVVSSQVMPAKTEGQFERIPIVVQLEGEIGALQAVLVVLASETPVVHVDAMNVQTIGAVKGDVPQRLNIRLNLFVLRSRT